MVYNKYYIYKEAVSYDSGTTWIYTGNEAPSGNPIATYDTLSECESSYTAGTKLFATYSDGRQQVVDCVGNELTAADTHLDVYGNSAMTSAVIGDCVTKIGYSTFWGCSKFKSIGSKGSGSSLEIPSSVTSIDSAVFVNCSGLTSVTIPDSVRTIGDSTFNGCSSLISATMPSGITSFGGAFFKDCLSLTSMTIPSSATEISDSLFWNCQSLKRLNSDVDGVFNLPSGITRIGTNAFNECRRLTAITMSNSIVSIEAQAFVDCSGLTSVTIPSSITFIGRIAFGYCTSLTSVTCLATTPPTLDYDNAFLNTNNCPIYVPAASVGAYKASWSDYASRIQAIP